MMAPARALERQANAEDSGRLGRHRGRDGERRKRMSDTKLQIEYVPISTVRKWPRNPKSHDLGTIHESIDKFGVRKPLVVNRKNMQIEAGHGRLETLLQKLQFKEPPPERILVRDEEWCIPVIFFDDDELTQEQFALVDNRSGELGGWDFGALVKELKSLNGDLKGTGFNTDDIDDICSKFSIEEDIEPDGDKKEIDENFETEHECPKCGFKW
jgi:hypothetical protein